jgi:hypothetical protein
MVEIFSKRQICLETRRGGTGSPSMLAKCKLKISTRKNCKRAEGIAKIRGKQEFELALFAATMYKSNYVCASRFLFNSTETISIFENN